MSKAALNLLARDLGKDLLAETWQKTSNEFRKGTLDYKKHAVKDFDATSIENQLRLQIRGFDTAKFDIKGKQTKEITDLYSMLDKSGLFPEAAAAYVKAVKESFTVKEKEAAIGLKGIIAVTTSFDGLNKFRLKKGEEAAKVVLKRVVSDSRLLENKLISADHTFELANIRFSSALYKAAQKGAGPDADASTIQSIGTKVLDDLLNKTYNGRALISKETYTYFQTAYIDISSKYTSGLSQKEFDINIGSEIEPRSQYDNEEAGRRSAKYFTELRKAAELLASKQNWEGQASSDSYVTAVMKQLNNSVVKAGATGKLQKINSAPSKTKVTKRFKVEQKISVVTLGSKAKSKKVTTTAPQPTSSKLSLANIVAYINQRLPEAIRSNMGNGALVNRTGRLSESARLVQAIETDRGFPSFGYTYLRSPYDVFDRTLGTAPWNTPGRDPRTLIEKSVRDVARDINIGRFYMRRA